MMRPQIYPFLTPDPDALDDHYREVLATIGGTVNADSMAANPRLMSDYLVLRSNGMVKLGVEITDELEEWGRVEIILTDKAKQFISTPQIASKFAPRRVTGDQTTIIGLRPRVGRKGYTWGHWEAITDEPDLFDKVILFREDFKAMERAGYKMPDWEDRSYDMSDTNAVLDIVFTQSKFDSKAKKPRKLEAPYMDCQIEVILCPERHTDGWRIERVIEPDLKWIFVRYDQLVVGDVFQLGNQGDCTIVSIGSPLTGVRYGTVRDSDGVRDFTFRNVSMYTLVKGKLLDAAQDDRELVEWAGNGYRWEGQGRKAG